METNFEIDGQTEIKSKNIFFDLHNNFDFSKIDFDYVERKVVLHWEKSLGEWAKNEIYINLVFLHEEVSFFVYGFLEKEESEYSEDKKTLSTITFYPLNDRDINNLCTDKRFSTQSDDIIYTFENGNFIRLNCKKITVSSHL